MPAAPTLELFLRPFGAEHPPRGLGDDALAHLPLAAPPAIRAHTAVDPGGDPGSLRDQGWGVIAPRGDDGDRLLAQLAPLIAHRAREQEADVAIYRVAPAMTATEASTWIDRQLIGNAMQAAIPAYLLIAGRADQVSFELQQALAGQFHVGRLGFDAAAAYDAYVAKLLRHEAAPAAQPVRAVYVTARDGSPAVELAHRLLMQPCVADAEAQRAAHRFAAREIAAISDGDPVQLLAAAAAPSVVFSCSHGAGAPAAGWGSAERRRGLQGALSLADHQLFDADRVARAPFAPGGAWMMFACFAAGTPARSVYQPWLARLRERGEFADDLAAVTASLPGDGEPPFVAALPQAALANPDGPLAVIGHVDLAWSYGFVDPDKLSRGERHRRFHELMTQLVRGTRVGLALSASLGRARQQVEHELAVAAANPDGPAASAHRWMVRQDLDGYIALGDPAARVAR
jgi:hypothetical protein